MVQVILDPNDSPGGSWTPSGPLPPEVRKFGKVPDLGSLQEGDLILVSAVAQPYSSRKIVDAQIRGGHSEDDARWHHAAIYVGDGNLCEARIPRVSLASIYDYVGRHLLRVRRDPNFSRDQGYRLAISSLSKLREPYSWSEIGRLWKQSREGFWQPKFVGVVSARICSKLYVDSHLLASITQSGGTAIALTNGKRVVQTPADLSLCPRLIDVQLRWLSIR